MRRREFALLVASAGLALAIACPGAFGPPHISQTSTGDAGAEADDATQIMELSDSGLALSGDGGWLKLFEGPSPRYFTELWGAFVEGPGSIRVLFHDYSPETKEGSLREVGIEGGVPIDREIWRDVSAVVPSALYLRNGTIWIANWTRGYPMPSSAFWLRKPYDAVEVLSCPNGTNNFAVQGELVEDGIQLVVPYLCNGECLTSSETVVIRLTADGGVRKRCNRTATTGSMPPKYWVQSADGTEITTSNGTGIERQMLEDMKVEEGGWIVRAFDSTTSVAYTGARTETPVIAEVYSPVSAVGLIGMSLGPDAGAHMRLLAGTENVLVRGPYARLRGKFIWIFTFHRLYDPTFRLGVVDPVGATFGHLPIAAPPALPDALGTSIELASDGTSLYGIARSASRDGGLGVWARRLTEFDQAFPER